MSEIYSDVQEAHDARQTDGQPQGEPDERVVQMPRDSRQASAARWLFASEPNLWYDPPNLRRPSSGID
jgi:hypothetical protein